MSYKLLKESVDNIILICEVNNYWDQTSLSLVNNSKKDTPSLLTTLKILNELCDRAIEEKDLERKEKLKKMIFYIRENIDVE